MPEQALHLHIQGQVQGVGFRPFVYRLALEMGLKGWVNNGVDGVHIELSGALDTVQHFAQRVVAEAPALARITTVHQQVLPLQTFPDFSIIASERLSTPQLLLTPDFALCADCKNELHQAQNFRYQYAFITCTNCGPRYSIITGLPYDRPLTTMWGFQMCPTCQAEYDDPLNRRYYAQTNSCPTCGIQLKYVEGKNEALENNEAALQATITALDAGKIVAVKGIGGFLLLADATNASTINLLRQRKQRPSKPFALLHPNLECLASDVVLSPQAVAALQSSVAPIVLLPLQSQPKSGVQVALLAPGLRRLGVMLPYAPLLELISTALGRPLVATSGNLSHTPIAYTNEEALERLSDIADGILLHNREIVVPQDDSVLAFTPMQQQKIVIRRSRGLAPTLLLPHFQPQNGLLAMGALLKSTFAFTHQNNLYLSQYLGDLEDFDTQQNYQLTLQHLLNTLQVEPTHILVDLHPAYASSQLGREMAEARGLTVVPIQHHLAHFGAVLAEHDLLDKMEPVLGVIWDGVGLGEDGQIWGGEFFVYQQKQFQRKSHFQYFPYFMGDKMAREPRLAAFAILGPDSFLEPKFSAAEWSNYQVLWQKKHVVQTSSMGRIFDAVAALLGIMDVQTYEGEAALRLEELAWTYWQGDNPTPDSYIFDTQPSPQYLLLQIKADVEAGLPINLIAFKFHFSLIELIKTMAVAEQVRRIAFSGGVWQNNLLVDLALSQLSGFQLYFHEEVSPNDEGVALGQVAVFELQVRAAK
ncbi:MAG: carbamoyltransferase HypF [Haliscomenobacter sp.]|uniref:carbamoyltransferase HypF n=1 Tax=Haliscomenobacter sp. TaxID=2717303 RepID=UPI0029BF7C3C|nr:carbamoyltransferase HypF [Haliscomenobacter sp.]MDX2071376.1 carbamoyltransferase HypF [Haliscomenobacter sp.]